MRRPIRSAPALPPSAADAAPPLFAALLDPACYPHPVAGVRVLETHISWVLLTGEYAYKIKKPVKLGFLDFSSLELRHRYCEEELRLNRRLAPELYLDLAEIRGTPGAPRIGGDGPVLEYAVRMREFPQASLASRALAGGGFGAAEIDVLAALVARFHASAPQARTETRYGAPDRVLADAVQNFEQMLQLAKAAPDDGALRALRLWTQHEFAARSGDFATRRKQGYVRECHGDLHLGNIVLLEGRPVPFDCIEFNDSLRWIDVMSEVAFLAMDLEDRGRRDLAWRFLNRYLEATGDYAGLAVLPFYLVYRALVRAKVHLMRSRQSGLRRPERARLTRAFEDYLHLAGRLAAPARPALILAHGLSGCGKTTLTQPLVEALGAIRVRSDLERKRAHGVAPLASSGSGVGSGLYSAVINAATYRRLGELAQEALRAGFSVVVDAAFLKRAERDAFRAIAERLDVPFTILDFHAPLEELRARITERLVRADDASEADLAVLERQLRARESLTPAEMAASYAVDTTVPAAHEMWRPLIERLHRLASGTAPHPAGRASRPDDG
ncbi:MAG TPA: AAA family ATPase [Burkholderiales bacterium]|nr:AAA family ATPase [Burkholderiales bacterium]